MAMWQRAQRLRRRRDLAAAGKLNQEYWYRPDELLVHRDDAQRLRPELDRWRFRPVETGETTAYREPETEPVLPAEEVDEAAERLGILRLRADEPTELPSLAARLRQVPDGPEPRVGPNHVLMGEPIYNGGPGDDPEPAPPGAAPNGDAGTGLSVAVLDTGLAKQPRPPGRFVLDEPRDHEVLDADGDQELDDQAGHGTFIAGVVLQRAPGVEVQVARVLDSFGIGDELTVAAGLLRRSDADIVNLSLGGYSHGDAAPVVLEAVLEQLDERVVVVAAAGNNRRARPMWPAAFSRVIAVGAYTTDGNGGPRRADFSNHGWWVDCCAPGVKVHSCFVAHDGPGGGSPDLDRFEGWARWSGTSFATPYVAGAIAAHAQRHGMTPRQAAFDLLHCRGLPRLPGLGTVL